MAQVATEAAVQDSAVVASVDMVAEASADLATEVQDLAAEVRVVSAAWEAAQNLAVEALADTEA